MTIWTLILIGSPFILAYIASFELAHMKPATRELAWHDIKSDWQ